MLTKLYQVEQSTMRPTKKLFNENVDVSIAPKVKTKAPNFSFYKPNNALNESSLSISSRRQEMTDSKRDSIANDKEILHHLNHKMKHRRMFSYRWYHLLPSICHPNSYLHLFHCLKSCKKPNRKPSVITSSIVKLNRELDLINLISNYRI